MIDASLLHDFIAETGEHLEELENHLLALEAAPDNRSLLNEIFRSVHTIKGASEYLGMARIARLSHTLESLLEVLRRGNRAPDQTMIDIIIDARDRIAMLLRDIEQDKAEKATIDDLIDRMDALQATPGPGNPKETPAAPLPELSFPELSFMDDAVEPSPAPGGDNASGAGAAACAASGSLAPPGNGLSGTVEAGPAACEDVCDEEYDAELFEIFIEHLREHLGRIREKIDAAAPSSDMADLMRECMAAVAALHSSSNYMDYEKIAKIHDTWRRQIEAAVDAMERGAPVAFETPAGIVSDPVSGMNAYIETLVQRFPQLADLGSKRPAVQGDENPDAPTAPPPEAPCPTPLSPADEGTPKPTGDFQGLFDELDGVFEAPAVEAPEPLVFEDILEDDQASVETRLAALSMAPAPSCGPDDPPERPDAPEDATELRPDPDPPGGEARDPEPDDGPVPRDPEVERAGAGPTETGPGAALKLKLVPPTDLAGGGGLPQDSGTAAAAPSEIPPAEATGEHERPEPPAEKAVKQSIRVDAGKVDALMNQVGELVVSRAWFSQLHQEMRMLQDYLKEKVGLQQREMKRVKALSFRISEAIVALSRASNDLQEGVMKVRMLPIAQLFNRYPRLVRDLVHDAPKRVRLEIIGEETELDKMVIEEISDPLLHLIRNAVDHGCETIPERLAAGKREECRLSLQSYHESNHVVIEIADDGRGIDPEAIRNTALKRGIATPEALDGMSRRELLEIIMKPGFSTAREVTKVSGRGVGMDVVRKNVEKLAGTIEIDSRVGEGTRFRIKIPLTLAIIQALLVRVGEEIFTIPLTAVEETLRIFREDVTTIEGVECIYLRNSTLSLLRLSRLFGIPSTSADARKGFVVVVNTGMRRVGLVVDALIGQEETVIKPLVDYLQESSGFSGATILGDGSISLILDVYELIKLSIGTHARAKHLNGISAYGERGADRGQSAAAASVRLH
jgi:two-component system chemotaxis sensor kinase CheA